MEARNAIFNAHGTIDCEVLHPVHGWIPFTASEHDPEKHGRDLYAELVSTASPYVAPPKPVPTSKQVNAERQRRISLGAVIAVTGAGNIPVQGRDQDVRNMQGLVMAASLRLGAGDTTTITTFRDADNIDHNLVPGQIIELWQKSAGYVSALYDASWGLKAMDPIPLDYDDDTHWPSRNVA